MTTDQPTPTSSLEEAREALLRRAPYYEDFDFQNKVRRLEAAVRAEVIREVEALTATVKDAQHLLRFVASDVKPRDVPAIMRVLASAEVTHEDCCSEQGIAALRALSQGGEGKA